MCLFSRFVHVPTLALLIGCGSSTEQAESTTPEPEPEPEPAAVVQQPAPTPTVNWAELDHEQRMSFMQERVTPDMTPIFQSLDAERFSNFTCPTCHGVGFQEVSFSMPNGVAPLDAASIPNLAQSDDERIARFAGVMGEQVAPRMVELLGVEPFDPETQEGFGCMRCHAMSLGAKGGRL